MSKMEQDIEPYSLQLNINRKSLYDP